MELFLQRPEKTIAEMLDELYHETGSKYIHAQCCIIIILNETTTRKKVSVP